MHVQGGRLVEKITTLVTELSVCSIVGHAGKCSPLKMVLWDRLSRRVPCGAGGGAWRWSVSLVLVMCHVFIVCTYGPVKLTHALALFSPDGTDSTDSPAEEGLVVIAQTLMHLVPAGVMEQPVVLKWTLAWTACSGVIVHCDALMAKPLLTFWLSC